MNSYKFIKQREKNDNLVFFIGFRINETDKGSFFIPTVMPKIRIKATYPGSSGERGMARSDDKDSSVFRHEARMQKGKVAVDMANLALATLELSK